MLLASGMMIAVAFGAISGWDAGAVSEASCQSSGSKTASGIITNPQATTIQKQISKNMTHPTTPLCEGTQFQPFGFVNFANGGMGMTILIRDISEPIWAVVAARRP